MRDTPLTRTNGPAFRNSLRPPGPGFGLSAQPIEHSAAERAIAALYAWACQAHNTLGSAPNFNMAHYTKA